MVSSMYKVQGLIPALLKSKHFNAFFGLLPLAVSNSMEVSNSSVSQGSSSSGASESENRVWPRNTGGYNGGCPLSGSAARSTRPETGPVSL